MKKVLRKLQSEQSLCSVYSDTEDFGRFSAGIIKYVVDDWYVMAHVNPYGAFDGYTCEMTDSVISVSRGDIYLNKLAILISDGNRIYDDLELPQYGGLVSRVLQHIKDYKEILTIVLMDESNLFIRGYVADFDQDILTIAEVNHNGEFDGATYVSIDDITKICFGSEDEVRLEKIVRK